MATHLFWFTHDLRLDDNRALIRAIDADQLLVVYVVDPAVFEAGRYGIPPMGAHRWRFIVESLSELDAQLQSMGQRLHIAVGQPEMCVPQLAKASGASRIICSSPIGFNETLSLESIKATHPEFAVEAVENFTLFEADQGDWLHSNLGQSFSKFRKVAEAHDIVPPVQAPAVLPPPPHLFASPPSDINALRERFPTQASATLSPYKGGAIAATQQLWDYFGGDHPATYKQTRNELDGWFNSSKLSVWLNNGLISVRRVKQQLERYEAQKLKNESTQWLYVELLWREYFQWLSRKTGLALFLKGGRHRKNTAHQLLSRTV